MAKLNCKMIAVVTFAHTNKKSESTLLHSLGFNILFETFYHYNLIIKASWCTWILFVLKFKTLMVGTISESSDFLYCILNLNFESIATIFKNSNISLVILPCNLKYIYSTHLNE